MPAPPAMTTMRAVVQDGYGSADLLHVGQVPVPQPAAGEVLVRVRAAGLDRGTWHLLTGRPYALRLVFGLRRPRRSVVGLDVAGTVVAVGAGAARFAVGDEVYGIAKGSFAEYAVAREDKLARKPANLSFEQAAVIAVSGQTALKAVLDAGRVQAGQSVLVTGASGGVGSYAVQIATALGAQVTGVASTAKLDLVRSLGAAHVVDYTREDPFDGTRRYDVVIDIAGSPSPSRLRRALTPTGTAVLVGGEEGGDWLGVMTRLLHAVVVSLFVRQRLTPVGASERARDELTDLLSAGSVTPTLEATYPLAQVPEAMRHLEGGRARGKVAISI
jgi:NADPH:quinone reductase-like Zn-dependent oxidoreductase